MAQGWRLDKDTDPEMTPLMRIARVKRRPRSMRQFSGIVPAAACNRNMTTAFKWGFRVFAALGIILLGLKVADRSVRHSGTLPDLPDPNGYATLIDVAHRIQGPEGDIAEVAADKVRDFAATQREYLDRVRLAVRGPSGVPLEADPKWADKQPAELTQLKRLAVLVGLRSKADLLEGRTNSAARAWVDMILLGQTITRGGRKLEALSGLAIEKVATASLRSMVPMLDASTCRGLAQDLERAEESRENAESILKTEERWSRATFGLVAKAGELFGKRGETLRRKDFLTRYRETERSTRRLILMLAARSKFLETGREVVNPSEVVPGVLKAVPTDPDTGAPFTELPKVP